MEKKFIKTRCVKDIIIFASLIVIGALLSFLSIGIEMNIVGWTLVITGIILAFVLKNGYKDINSGEAISRILSRKNIHRKSFDAETINKLESMVDEIDTAYEAMLNNLEEAHKGTLIDISNSYNAEERINSMRSNLRECEIEEIENGGKNYQTSVYYMDIINQLERMGDFIINISQDLERSFKER